MRSGQLAHLSVVSTDTLRHYERLGLLPPQRAAQSAVQNCALVHYAVLEGLNDQDELVTDGSYILKAEAIRQHPE